MNPAVDPILDLSTGELVASEKNAGDTIKATIKLYLHWMLRKNETLSTGAVARSNEIFTKNKPYLKHLM